MPIMKSPAGDMEITIEGLTAKDSQLLAVGKFGVWEATIVLSVEDVMGLIPLMLKGSVIMFLLKLPFTYIKKKFQK